MPPKRNYPYGASKEKKRKRVQKLIASQAGAIHGYFPSIGNQQTENSNKDLGDETIIGENNNKEPRIENQTRVTKLHNSEPLGRDEEENDSDFNSALNKDVVNDDI